MPHNFTTAEKKWQAYWLKNKTFRALDPIEAKDKPKVYVLDMFPYPSGDGLHVGHVIQQTATDIVCRHLRMKGWNVLHPMGWDAFGLPAEEYARKHNIHPAISTKKNVDNFRKQIQMLGMGYDWDREVNTTDPKYYKWTQWIFLQIYNSYFDPQQNRAMPISHLVNELQNENFVVTPDDDVVINPTLEAIEALGGQIGLFRRWRDLSVEEQRIVIDNQRLTYIDEVPVNWCEGLGTVLANEEVIDGKSERGNFPVERRPMRQWMMCITKYADRLIEDLNDLDWSESLKEMQRNWIGRSTGAEVDFEVANSSNSDTPQTITVFTTRPDTLFGATYMVLAPEHPLVDAITTSDQKKIVADYKQKSASKSERDRQESKEKSGVFTGAYALNPVNDEKIPIWIADYVLTGYGTGAIMAVPAHDERDFEFATKFKLPIRMVVKPSTDHDFSQTAFAGEGVSVNSDFLNGRATDEAKEHMIVFLETEGLGRRKVNYKLRDWLFSRQRYWGEPFPIVMDENGNHFAVDESELPVTLPELNDFKPTGTPEGPLSKATDWLKYNSPERRTPNAELRRETNTMPQWAGSCWYYLRYIDPTNANQFVDPEKEKYWMPVDLYVGGVEHAVLHLLYARFWHKVLFDLGHVSSNEPFKRLVNQGLILGETEFHFFELDGKPISATELKNIDEEATDRGAMLVGFHKQSGKKALGTRVSPLLIEKVGDRYVLKANKEIAVDARSFKMSKSRGNVVNPDEIIQEYGADAFRLYEMYMGPLEAQKPWNTRDIVGMARFLNSVWRNLVGDEESNKVAQIVDEKIPDALDRMMHRTIKKVSDDIVHLRFNTAIAELIKLNNEITGLTTVPRELAETLTLMLAPFAPHMAEELWAHLGKPPSVATASWPICDESKLVESTMEIPIQVNGKLRGKISVDVNALPEAIIELARAEASVKPWIEGKSIKKEVYVPGRMVSFVVA